ncbi:HSP20 family protein [Anseongella ginsenosidimutans]|uniref:HSP20 family protein n=1 Tax=Anseongella ginsenosidimutans TaxID=496056 RepID=A0A4R3KS58_9SPHI|nr:Hsp20/alpha crystallin family protein [Anseongella ginsenosidimutans]QEC53247.1 Hsp20/alpha crystallin family protein [Anseongella ginsenosidimutans]TCS87884.1 HSP20 family protein [Anseongella ginsenosidimutans]
MTLVKWNESRNGRYPRVFGTSLSPVFNELFDDFFGGRSLSGALASKAPAVNVSEDKDSYRVELAAPGLKKEDFKLNVEDNLLSISVEKKEEKDEKENGYTRREFNYTNFSRSFTLPETVNTESIKAVYKDGILEIDLPKKEEEKTKNRVIDIS